MEPIQSAQPVTHTPCPFCSTPVDAATFFCPACGKTIRVKPPSTGFWTQLGLYLVSVLFPPLFLGLTIKYLKSPDPKAKQIGLISLGLTITALVGAVFLSVAFTKNITQQIKQQLNLYQNMGL